MNGLSTAASDDEDDGCVCGQDASGAGEVDAVAGGGAGAAGGEGEAEGGGGGGADREGGVAVGFVGWGWEGGCVVEALRGHGLALWGRGVVVAVAGLVVVDGAAAA